MILASREHPCLGCAVPDIPLLLPLFLSLVAQNGSQAGPVLPRDPSCLVLLMHEQYLYPYPSMSPSVPLASRSGLWWLAIRMATWAPSPLRSVLARWGPPGCGWLYLYFPAAWSCTQQTSGHLPSLRNSDECRGCGPGLPETTEQEKVNSE